LLLLFSLQWYRMRLTEQKNKKQTRPKAMVDQYKKQIDNVMSREVSRGEFLKLMGAGILGVIGVVGFFRNLHDISPSGSPAKKQSSSGGYGRSAYGR